MSRLVDVHGSFVVRASDNTGCSLAFTDGIISVADESGHIVAEFDADDAPVCEADSVKPVPLRVEVENFGFCHRKHYFCPSCGTKIGDKTFEEERQFGQGTILHSNQFPNFCPNCGVPLLLV